MHMYFKLGSLQIPSYGLMIVLGLLSANLLLAPSLKKKKLRFDDAILLQAYALLGVVIGAKLFFFLVSWKLIDWSRIFDLEYLQSLMKAGFVFYGGLIGGLCTVSLAKKIHKLDIKQYLFELVPFVPWIHAFGRIGCFLSGCCYGKPYSGIFAVTYPEGSLPPSDISLFPVQLLEAFCLFILFFILRKIKEVYRLESYLLFYGIIRFILEYLRYDEARGGFLFLSTSQWISVFIVFIVLSINLKRSYSKKQTAN